MMPRLSAETSLLERERIAMGVGAVTEPEKVMQAWIHQAAGHTRRPRAAKATPETLAFMGVGVIDVDG